MGLSHQQNSAEVMINVRVIWGKSHNAIKMLLPLVLPPAPPWLALSLCFTRIMQTKPDYLGNTNDRPQGTRMFLRALGSTKHPSAQNGLRLQRPGLPAHGTPALSPAQQQNGFSAAPMAETQSHPQCVFGGTFLPPPTTLPANRWAL